MLYSSPLRYQRDASAYFSSIRDLPWAAWLDSGGSGRFDILVAQPVVTLVTQGGQTEIRDQYDVRTTDDEAFTVLHDQLGEPVVPMPDIPFAGGALGYWSYDLARNNHRLPETARDAEHLPDMAIGIYDWAFIIDHQECTARLVSRQRYAETGQLLEQILERLQKTSTLVATATQTAFRVQGPIRSNLSRDAYQEAFNKVSGYLREGDCYQVNLAQRFAVRAEGDAFSAYLELRRLSPAPFSAFLDWPDVQILSASPERFLQVRQGDVETKPIKGTRPRSTDRAEDARLANELSQHPKDRAENLMIVDLLRNDLGKSCEPGTVKVPKLFEVESFSNVHHLVSTVVGKLRAGRTALDAMRDCFPGGSITGAPKHRAMEIIEQLEPNRRGVYCGTIGYVGHDRNMDSNIAIRTLVYSAGEIRCWAGGGIVADSNCEAEYQESMDKAVSMLELLRRFGGTRV
jgi:para-aminobenzoate synthetase component 1